MMCSTYAWRSNGIPFSSRDCHTTLARPRSIRALGGQNRGIRPRGAHRRKLAKVVKVAKAAKVTRGRRDKSGGAPVKATRLDHRGFVLRIRTRPNRPTQERSDSRLRRSHPVGRGDVEQDQPPITAQPGFLMTNVTVRVNPNPLNG